MPSREYATKQKETVAALMERCRNEVLTAEQVHERLSAQGASIGLTTVYRTLRRLAESGVLRAFEGVGSAVGYQLARPDCADHLHLVCDSCGAVTHLHCSLARSLGSHLLAEHGFALSEERTVLHGLCAACRKERAQ